MSGVFPIGTSLSNCLTAARPIKKGSSRGTLHGGAGSDGGDGGGGKPSRFS
ncbi:MAG: hypothetical protein ACJ0DG_11270 [bacterium]